MLHAALAVLALAAAAGSPDWSRPRELPSLVIRWTRSQGACAVLAHGDVVFALEPQRVVALDAREGRVRWEHALDSDDCPYWWQFPLLLHGGVLAAAAGEKVYLLAPQTGERLQTVALPGRFARVWGPPLLVSVDGEDSDTLLSIDVATSGIVGRHDTHGDLYGLAHDETHALLHTAPDRLTGLRLPKLARIWTAEGFSGAGHFGRQFFAGRQAEGCNCRESAHVVDPASGKVGGARFERAGSSSHHRDRWDLELLESEDESSTTVQRRRGDGRLMWTRTVPAPVSSWSVEGDTLLLDCETGGRGVLARLDWRTGDLLSSAYGVRDLVSVARNHEGLILLTTDRIIQVADTLGPPETATVPIKDAVAEILAGEIETWSDARDLAGEVAQLGAEAWPVLLEAAREAKGWPLAIAAWCLGAAEYAPAAPVLASRLARDDDFVYRSTVDAALLEALARVATDEETTRVIGVLEDPERPDGVRLQAFAVLVNIGSPTAIGAADRVIAARRLRFAHASFAPSAQPLLDLIGPPVDDAAREKAEESEDYDELARIDDAGSAARAPLPSGHFVVVFRNARLGRSADLWIEEFDAHGRPKTPATFLGAVAPGPPCPADPCPIDVAVDGATLRLSSKSDGASSVSVDLAAARRDSDGDGLADLVEERIGTKAAASDSDGDGITDEADMFPNTASGTDDAERARIIQEILEQYALLAGARDELAVLVGDVVPERSGRSAPTLVMTRDAATQFKEAGALEMLPLITIEPMDAQSGPAGPIAAYTRAGATPVGALGPDDRAYTLTIYRQPLWAVGYNVVVRRQGGRWRIRHFAQAWIS